MRSPGTQNPKNLRRELDENLGFGEIFFGNRLIVSCFIAKGGYPAERRCNLHSRPSAPSGSAHSVHASLCNCGKPHVRCFRERREREREREKQTELARSLEPLDPSRIDLPLSLRLHEHAHVHDVSMNKPIPAPARSLHRMWDWEPPLQSRATVTLCSAHILCVLPTEPKHHVRSSIGPNFEGQR